MCPWRFAPATRRGPLLAAALALLLGSVHPIAGAFAVPAGDVPHADGKTEGRLLLEVILNGGATGLIAAFTEGPGGGLLIEPAELAELGIVSDPAALRGGLIDLDRLPGLRYRYDRAAQVLRIDAATERLVLRVIEGRLGAAGGTVSEPVGGRGAVLNYTLFASGDADFDIAASGAFDGRVFGPLGVFRQSGLARIDRHGFAEAIRLDSSYSYSDQKRMLTYSAGDLISGGLAWTRPVRLGGVQVSRNFLLRPDLVTMPIPAFAGSAAVPSTVEVYANGVQLYNGAVPPGPFTISNLPVVSGAGTARVVVTDSLGRRSESNVPFFASSALLRKGLTDFSVEAGFPRRSFGVESFDYASSPAVSASLRHGVSDRLTLESHAEATTGLVNGGAGLVMPIATTGLLSVAAAGSTGEHTGMLANADIDLRFGKLGLRLRSQRSFGDYADIASATATVSGAAPMRAIDQASLSFPVGTDRSRATVSLTRTVPVSGDTSMLVGLSYGRRIMGDVSLLLVGYHALAGKAGTGMFVGFSRSFAGGLSATASLRDSRTGTGAAIDVSGSPRESPLSWRAAAASDGNWLAAGRLRTSFATLDASLRGDSRGGAVAGIEANGTIAAAGGGVFFANRIDDAFAVVDVGAPGVTVYFENRPIGRTDQRGRLLVPGLRSYETNTISINPDDLPADLMVGRTKVAIRPADRAGVSVDLKAAEADGGARVVLRGVSGAFLPPGSQGSLGEGNSFIVGYDGEAYVTGLSRQNRVKVALADGRSCSASFEYRPQPGPPPLIDGVVCQ